MLQVILWPSDYSINKYGVQRLSINVCRPRRPRMWKLTVANCQTANIWTKNFQTWWVLEMTSNLDAMYSQQICHLERSSLPVWAHASATTPGRSYSSTCIFVEKINKRYAMVGGEWSVSSRLQTFVRLIIKLICVARASKCNIFVAVDTAAWRSVLTNVPDSRYKTVFPHFISVGTQTTGGSPPLFMETKTRRREDVFAFCEGRRSEEEKVNGEYEETRWEEGWRWGLCVGREIEEERDQPAWGCDCWWHSFCLGSNYHQWCDDDGDGDDDGDVTQMIAWWHRLDGDDSDLMMTRQLFYI